MNSSQINSPTAKLERKSARYSALPELLAPAGDWECARAAVENGADGIYFGLEKFNARMRARNFTEADLTRLMDYLHRRGVKGYVTFNILVFENEMAQAEEYARAIIAAGVDAAIVQDVGICRLIRQLSPDFPIHVSTQMTITSARGIEFARELGCNLVVLARECSVKEIEKIQTSQLDNHQLSTNHHPLPLEVFIHGALCIAYSGQCLTSEALGGRSANRGECAQACRLPYDLISDGQPVPLGDRKYLLSPQDLAGLDVLSELVRLGVASLKIEGRLKSPEYVANITRIYRKALDALAAPVTSTNEDLTRILPAPDAGSGDPACSTGHRALVGRVPSRGAQAPPASTPQYEMEMAFSRGLYTGWFEGTNNQALVHARFGKKRGVYLGQVTEVRREAVLIQLENALKPGDGVVFDAGKPEEKEEGGRVYEIRNPKSEIRKKAEIRNPKPEPLPAQLVELRFGQGDVDFHRVHVGDRLWKTSDPELDRRLRQSFAGDTPRFQRPISMEVHGLEGGPLTLIARDELGHISSIASAMPLSIAKQQPLTTDRLREQLGRLGGTPFRLGELKNLLAGDVLLPVSELNRLRREIVRELEAARARPLRWALRGDSPGKFPLTPALSPEERVKQGPNQRDTDDVCLARHPEAPLPFIAEKAASQGIQEHSGRVTSLPLLGERAGVRGNDEHDRTFATAPRNPSPEVNLAILVRNLQQLEAALACGVRTLYCEFEDPKKYREAVRAVRTAPSCQSASARPLEIFVASPRIFKTGEEWTLKQVRSSEADGYLIRNYDHLDFFARDRCVGDYSLNIANALAADYFKNKFSLERVTASYDLNFVQLQALLEAAPPEWFEITIHQHIPMFHMEHCLFCAFLSKGTDYTNCGRPCNVHDVKLRDRVGAQHPVKADAGCRNTVFNSQAQTGAEYVPQMLALGVRHFRLEFLNQTPMEMTRIIGKYRQLFAGEITGAQLWRELKLFNQLGVTRGQMAAH